MSSLLSVRRRRPSPGRITPPNRESGAKKILWLCLLLSTVCSSVLIFTIVLFRDFFSGLFTPDRAVVESAAVRIMCILLFEPICNLYEFPAGVLRGSGHALYPAAAPLSAPAHSESSGYLPYFEQAPRSPCCIMRFRSPGSRQFCLSTLGFW